MNIRNIGISIVGTLVLAGTLAGGQGKTDATLDKMAQEFAAAFNNRDAAKVASFYAEDGVLMPPNRPMVKGRANIEMDFKKAFAEGITSLQLRPTESAAAGNQAFEAGTLSFAMTNGGAVTGKYLIVFKREGGIWKIAYDSFNSDQPPPPQK